MGTEFSLYPATPAAIPRHLVNPSSRYRLLVVLVLASLLLFMLLYLALVAGSGYLAYWSVTYPMGQVSKGTILVKAGVIAISVMLFLFLLKGLFKSHQVDTANYVALRETDHPALFRFLRELCRDTGAPFPRQVFVNPEVNASVFYNSLLLSLLFPVRKNLLIGLGLVNVLDLNEFKAVLAHEFGHFSQSSMKVGSYVYMANRIITDMVYGRDSWDNLLREWQNSDFRLAVFGWGLGGIVWGLRQILAGIFRVLNLGNLALSRQMEFNADLVAVSVTGSDALIHALAKLDFANQALMQACKDLQDASDHRLYSADMFYHQTRAQPHLRAVLKNPLLGKVPELLPNPAARNQVFQPGAEAIPNMWASHPTNYDREENAKRLYFRSLADERSPWDLFGNAAAVRARITHNWDIVRDLLDHRARVDGTLNFLGSGPQLTEADLAEVVQTFRSARRALANALADAQNLSLPRLKNMRGDENLARFLLDEPLVSDLIGGTNSLEGAWIGAFLKQISLVQDRLRRMHFKSMGGILALQEQIARALENRPAAPPEEKT